jgi:hypothetical protein
MGLMLFKVIQFFTAILTTTKYTLLYPGCTIILPVVLYGYETWSLTLREECRLGLFENRVLRRIFGPKRDEVTGQWRRLHNEQPYAQHHHQISFECSIQKDRWVGHVGRMGERRGAGKVLVGKPEGRRPL